MMHDWGMSWGWGGMLFQLLFWLVIVFLIIWGVKQIAGRNQNSNQLTRKDNVLDILRERYAKGEIDKEEFEAKKRDLT
ncbi:MAG TPA: SHOCT domain-containing protein [bacterium]